MKKETATNYPSQTVMKKEIIGQSGINIFFKFKKDFQFGNHFHTTLCSKGMYLSMLFSNLKSLNTHSSFLHHKSNDEDVKSNTGFDWHCQALEGVQR